MSADWKAGDKCVALVDLASVAREHVQDWALLEGTQLGPPVKNAIYCVRAVVYKHRLGLRLVGITVPQRDGREPGWNAEYFRKIWTQDERLVVEHEQEVEATQ